MSEPVTQVLGEAGEPCRNCGAPLAADQRYCLHCGERRGEPRIDFREHAPGPEAPVTAAPAGGGESPAPTARPTEPQAPRHDFAPLAAVGGIAVLGLMLLVGVLIGKGSGNSTSTTPPPVVRVGEGGATKDTAAGDGREGGKTGTADSKKAEAGGARTASSGRDLVNGSGGSGPVEASDQALKELQEQDPEEYSKNSAKLPDEIATGGELPPKDSKAPGGGSKGTAVE